MSCLTYLKEQKGVNFPECLARMMNTIKKLVLDRPRITYTKCGLYTVRVSAKANYTIYEVCVTGGFRIYKKATAPSEQELNDSLLGAFHQNRVSLDVLIKYMDTRVKQRLQ